MKKYLFNLLFAGLFLILFAAGNISFAIASNSEMQYAVTQLHQLSSFDFSSFVNKNELIGYRLDMFNMATLQYKRNVDVAKEKIFSGLNKIDIINNSSDYSDTDKEIQIRQIYQEADMALSDVNSETINYLINLRRNMPTLTYQHYVKKFQNYYNSLAIGSSNLKM